MTNLFDKLAAAIVAIACAGTTYLLLSPALDAVATYYNIEREWMPALVSGALIYSSALVWAVARLTR